MSEVIRLNSRNDGTYMQQVVKVSSLDSFCGFFGVKATYGGKRFAGDFVVLRAWSTHWLCGSLRCVRRNLSRKDDDYRLVESISDGVS